MKGEAPAAAKPVLPADLPIGAAAQLAVGMYEKIISTEYSEQDIKRLTELKHLFQEVLQNAAPISWELDDKKCPTHRISHHKWADHVRQLTKGKHKAGRFHYQSSLIAEYASTYLAERGKRWVGNGKSGDLLEQFIGEWIGFAINELPSLDFDEESKQKLKQRIKYLEKIQKHEFLFKFGTVTRRRNKFDTIESIKQQLYSSIDLVSKESLRQCAREKLDLCRANTASLLLGCVKSFYYARSTVVYHEPLELQSFLDPEESFLTTSAQVLYPKVKATHTGCLLQEMVSIAGLEAFGAQGSGKKVLIQPLYFEDNFSPKAVDWKKRDFDLPPWITAKQAIPYIREHQQVAESALRVAQLKNMVEVAYDLTGKVGDVWAYGDAEGRLSLEGLLFMLERELDVFYQRFDKLYQFQNRQRHIYNLRNRINPDDPINRNFNQVDAQHEDVTKFYNALKQAIKSINDRMADFTEAEVRRIDAKKRNFYKSIFNYMQQYYPEQAYKYEALAEVVQVEAESQKGQDELEICLAEESYSFRVPEFLPPAETAEDLAFKSWRREFILCYAEEHRELQRLKEQFMKKVDSQASLKEIRGAALDLKHQVEWIKQKAEGERPCWSWSLRTAGWPFNQDISARVNRISEDLDSLVVAVGATLGNDLSTPTPPPSSSSIAMTMMLTTKNKTKYTSMADRVTQLQAQQVAFEETRQALRRMTSYYGKRSLAKNAVADDTFSQVGERLTTAPKLGG